MIVCALNGSKHKKHTLFLTVTVVGVDLSPYRRALNVRILIKYGFSEQFLDFHLCFTHQCRQKRLLLKIPTSIYVDFYHNLGWGMYINWILKTLNPRNSNLVRKNRENNCFSSRTKFEFIRYVINWEIKSA